ncbi:hypothetical protein GJ496_005621 [Pomphorhynchus laevis]|nr:hypothetical protein GJ496_005621 [Pomphorhynchus laevis]
MRLCSTPTASPTVAEANLSRKLSLDEIYEEVIRWPPSLLDPPPCNAIRDYIVILADIYYRAAREDTFHNYSALKAATVLSRASCSVCPHEKLPTSANRSSKEFISGRISNSPTSSRSPVVSKHDPDFLNMPLTTLTGRVGIADC